MAQEIEQLRELVGDLFSRVEVGSWGHRGICRDWGCGGGGGGSTDFCTARSGIDLCLGDKIAPPPSPSLACG